MSFLDLRDEYVTRWGAWDSVRHARPHDQDFSDGEFGRIGSEGTPLVLVTCMGIAEDEDTARLPGELVEDFQFAAIVITRPGDARRLGSQSPGDVSAAIAARIVRDLVRGAEFSEACGLAERIEAGNISTTSNAMKGATVWAVAWKQPASIEDDVAIVLEDLETIHTRFNDKPEPDVGDPVDPDLPNTISTVSAA